jgi:hypothetical protein
MIMCSLFLLIQLIPWHLLKLIPPSHLQTHLPSLTFIYPHVTFQIPSHWLYVTPLIPTPTHWLSLRASHTLYRPLPICQKEIQACHQEGFPSYWRTTWEVLHRAQNHQQSTQWLTSTQPQPPTIQTHQPLHPQATRPTWQEPSWQLPVASRERPDARLHASSQLRLCLEWGRAR